MIFLLGGAALVFLLYLLIIDGIVVGNTYSEESIMAVDSYGNDGYDFLRTPRIRYDIPRMYRIAMDDYHEIASTIGMSEENVKEAENCLMAIGEEMEYGNMPTMIDCSDTKELMKYWSDIEYED